MEQVQMIVTALVLGAGACLEPTAEPTVKEAYADLKALVLRTFGAQGDVAMAVDAVEKKPGSAGRKETLAEEMAAAGISQDREALAKAMDLLALLAGQSRPAPTPAAKKEGRRLAPALLSLLESPFTAVIGNLQESHDGLKQEVMRFLEENGETNIEGLSLGALTQRCVLRFGEDVLLSLFQQAASLSTSIPPLVASLGRLVQPGVHVTLLWQPYLERAIAEQQGDRTVYAIQPGGKPRVIKRTAGASTWKMEPVLPKRFDFDREIVVVRLSGGYSAEPRPVFSPPLVTDDDYRRGMLDRPPAWMEDLLARARIQPGLFVGLSVLDWRDRMLLERLYDLRPAPQGSLVLLPPTADSVEGEIWDSGAGLPGSGRIATITEEPAQLATQLDTFAPATRDLHVKVCVG